MVLNNPTLGTEYERLLDRLYKNTCAAANLHRIPKLELINEHC